MAASIQSVRLTRPSRRGGQVLAMTLLALTALAGLLFYAYNVGDTVNRRLDLQSAADATAVSGATMMARGMNLVAADNIGITRMICMSAVLDSLPLAAEMTLAEEQGADSLTTGLKKQLDRGVPGTPVEQQGFLRAGLDKYYRQLQDTSTPSTQLDAFQEIVQRLRSGDQRNPVGAVDVRPFTHWDWSGVRGHVWQAAEALDRLSQSTAESAGVMAQADAQRFGQANQAEAALLTPLLPVMPARRGGFNDFQSLLMDSVVEINAPTQAPPREQHSVSHSNLVGRLQGARDFLVAAETASVHGGAIPDYAYPHRLGPFARLFRWRNSIGMGGWSNQTSVGVPEYDLGSHSFGGAPGVQIGYSTYGPMEWAMQRAIDAVGLTGRVRGPADTSRFVHHLRRVSMVKLAYLFGLTSPRQIQYAKKWMTDYNEAKAFATAPATRGQILRTQYYRANVKSVRKWDDGLWLRIPREYNGTISPLNDPPSSMWVWPADPTINGWYDIQQRVTTDRPRVLQQKWYNLTDGTRQQRVAKELLFVQWENMGEFVWRVKMEFQVDEDWDLGLTAVQNPDGSPKLYTTYAVGWYVFRGAEVRDPVTIDNPGNWPGGADLPAPMLLDTSRGDYNPDVPDADSGARRAAFTFLGSARRSLPAALWPAKFSRTVAAPASAFAQAKIFNNKSWDLWTQDWQVQLMPVTQWEDWRGRLSAGQADLPRLTGLVDSTQVQALQQFINDLPASGLDLYVKH